MGKLRVVFDRAVRPQIAVGLAVVLFVAIGLWTSTIVAEAPKIVRPTHGANVPVIQPQDKQVESAAIIPPVDCAKVACIALTFDDGPNPQITPQVLDILKRHNVKATFFLIGVHVPGNEALVKRIHQEGHEIGNHTWSHRDLATLSPAEIEDEVTRTQAVISAAGVPLPRIARPPYGGVDTKVLSHIPLTVVKWNIDPEDWKARKKAAKIVEHVLTHARPGGIVDLHDIKQVTVDALEPILAGLEQNYRLVTVSELLDLPPGQPGIFYGR